MGRKRRCGKSGEAKGMAIRQRIILLSVAANSHNNAHPRQLDRILFIQNNDLIYLSSIAFVERVVILVGNVRNL